MPSLMPDRVLVGPEGVKMREPEPTRMPSRRSDVYRSKTGNVLLVLSLVSLLGAGVWASAGEPTAEPLPFDPLSQAEQDAAVATALDDIELQKALGVRHVTIGAASDTDKRDVPPSEWTRRADVWFYSYSTDQTFHVKVDLTLGEMLSVTPVDFQPPLVGREAARAGELAAADERVLAAIPDGAVATAVHLRSDTTGPCAVHRCAEVALFVDDIPWFPFFVVVDLSNDQVVRLIDNPGYVGWDGEGSA